MGILINAVNVGTREWLCLSVGNDYIQGSEFSLCLNKCLGHVDIYDFIHVI